MFESPVTRLAGRALLAGLAVFLTTLQTTSGHIGRDVLAGALTSAGLAALEVLTPLNKTVGVGK